MGITKNAPCRRCITLGLFGMTAPEDGGVGLGFAGLTSEGWDDLQVSCGSDKGTLKPRPPARCRLCHAHARCSTQLHLMLGPASP